MNRIYLHYFLPAVMVLTSLLPLIACAEPDTSLKVLSLNVTPATIMEGQSVQVEAQIRNDGYSVKEFDVPVMLNKIAEDRKFVTLAPGASEKVSFNLRLYKSGRYTIAVGSQDNTVEVRKPVPATIKLTKLEIKPAEASVGDDVVITADVSNSGEVTGKLVAELKVDGVIKQTYECNLMPGAGSFVVFKASFDTAGSHKVSIGDLTGQVAISAPIVPIQVAPTNCPPSQKWDPGKKC